MAPAQVPTLDKFPSFNDLVSLLTDKAQQCIWYLPDKGRRCFIKITAEENESAFQRAANVWKSCLSTSTALEDLITIAKECCCLKCHRNKFGKIGLARELAIQWYHEIHKMQLGLGLVKERVTLKIEVEVASASSPVEFVKHHVFPEETLLSKLQSPLKSLAAKQGSIYFYTHEHDVFSGMVKIGYTGNTIASRLQDWAGCGHGYPKLLASFLRVRHPERVELLTHFELLEDWHENIWCNVHRKSHVEWFKVELERAKTVARLWSQWMERAEPYDRRGHLTTLWRGHIDFLVQHGNPITAEAMMLIQRIDEGSDEVEEFIDDEALRKMPDVSVKKEEEEGGILSRLPERALTGKIVSIVKSEPV